MRFESWDERIIFNVLKLCPLTRATLIEARFYSGVEEKYSLPVLGRSSVRVFRELKGSRRAHARAACKAGHTLQSLWHTGRGCNHDVRFWRTFVCGMGLPEILRSRT